jgi:hypothetical protein
MMHYTLEKNSSDQHLNDSATHDGQRDDEDEDEDEDNFSTLSVQLTIVTNCIIMLVAIPSNTIVLYSTRKITKRRSSTFMLISQHLCFASLYIACIAMPINTIWLGTHKWYAGALGCKMFMALRVIGFYMSAFLIVTLSIHRYV